MLKNNLIDAYFLIFSARRQMTAISVGNPHFFHPPDVVGEKRIFPLDNNFVQRNRNPPAVCLDHRLLLGPEVEEFFEPIFRRHHRFPLAVRHLRFKIGDIDRPYFLDVYADPSRGTKGTDHIFTRMRDVKIHPAAQKWPA